MFRIFPWSNLHDLNLDWIVSKIKNIEDAEKNSAKSASNAEASALEASNSAIQASASANDAQSSANDSASSAEQASGYLGQFGALSNQVDVLTARMNQYESLAEGSTTGDAELQDLRIGADGVTYASAGEAVRSQLNRKLNIFGLPVNYLASGTDLNTLANGTYICQNGTIGRTLINTPYTGQFRMDVFDTRATRLWLLTSDYGDMPYIRKSKGTVFYEWQQITTNAQLVALTNTINTTISDLTNNNIDVDNLKAWMFEKGNINENGGDTTYAEASRIRSKDINHASSTFSLAFITSEYPNASILKHTYDAEGNHLATGGWTRNLTILKDEYFRLIISLDRTSTSTLYTIEDTLSELLLDNTVNNSNNSVRCVCHQGNVGSSDNHCKLEGYLKAYHAGYDMVEGDIKFTSDNIPVVTHDGSFVDATSGDTITIASNTYAFISTCDYYGGKIATLEELINLCKRYGLDVILDQINNAWTDDQFNAIMNIIHKYGYINHTIFMPYTLEGAVKVLDKDAHARIMCGEAYASTSLQPSIDMADAIAIQYPDTDLTVMGSIARLGESIIANGRLNMNSKYKLAVYTVDTVEDKRIYSQYADYLITDMNASLFNI